MRRVEHRHVIILPLVAALCFAGAGRAPASSTPTPRQDDAREAAAAEPAVERNAAGLVTIKLTRGARVAVDNRTTGRITVTGWERDYIEAKATSELGVEYVRARVGADSSGASVFLKADYASGAELAARREETEARRREFEARRGAATAGTQSPAASASPTPTPARSPTPVPSEDDRGRSDSDDDSDNDSPDDYYEHRSREVHLEVKLPRRTELELVRVYRSDVEVSGLDTRVVVVGERSTIRLSAVASAEVRTKSGPVEVERAAGLVDVTTTSGPIRVRDAGGDVRALSISGRVEVRCARGRVIAGNTDGEITLEGVGGDVDASSTNGEIVFAGAVRGSGRYSLKSMSGRVVMRVRPGPEGFTAALSSYRGALEADLPMKITQSTKNDPVNRRLVGRYGNGQAQITLDTFDGAVTLGQSAATNNCP